MTDSKEEQSPTSSSTRNVSPSKRSPNPHADQAQGQEPGEEQAQATASTATNDEQPARKVPRTATTSSVTEEIEANLEGEGSAPGRTSPKDLANLTALYYHEVLEPCLDERDVLYEHKKEYNDKIMLWQGDITELQVDAIVNAANTSLLGGGGVDGAIHRAAGPSLLKECRTLEGCKTGQTKITKGYDLPAKHVLHTVGPIYSKKNKEESEQLLRSCYSSCLKLLKEHGLKTIAFSGISTGVYGYPLNQAPKVALDEVRKFLNEDDYSEKIERIIFINFRQKDIEAYQHYVPVYFPPAPSSVIFGSKDVASDEEDEVDHAEKKEVGEQSTVEEEKPQQ